MKQIIKYSIMASLAANLLAGTPVLAYEDAKIFPGSMCNWQAPGVTSGSHFNNDIKNTTNNNQWVTCPMVRDSTLQSTEYAQIMVKGDVVGSCYMQIGLINGGVNRIPHNKVVELDNGRKSFQWFNGADVTSPNHPEASYSLECNLKPNASITRYYLLEDDK